MGGVGGRYVGEMIVKAAHDLPVTYPSGEADALVDARRRERSRLPGYLAHLA